MQAFAEFFNTKIKNIAEQNAVQDGVWSGDRVMYAGEASYITIQKTEDIMKNLKLKNSYGCDRIPLEVLQDRYTVLGKPVCELMEKIYAQKKTLSNGRCQG